MYKRIDPGKNNEGTAEVETEDGLIHISHGTDTPEAAYTIYEARQLVDALNEAIGELEGR